MEAEVVSWEAEGGGEEKAGSTSEGSLSSSLAESPTLVAPKEEGEMVSY